MAETLPVTVVIPAYNRAALAERALRSVFAQEVARPSEVLLVDDASTDDTGSRAGRLGARVVRHEVNRGEGAARNTGLREASQPWVALLDSDDEWLPHHLATVWQLAGEHVLACTSCVQRTDDGRGGRLHGWTGSAPRGITSPAELLFPQNLLAPSATLLRREVALEVGGFPEAMPRMADLDLWIRMVEMGPAVVSPEVSVIWHQHEGQVSKDRAEMRRAQLRTIDSYAGRPWNRPALRQRYLGLMAWDDRVDRGPAALLGLAGHPRRLEGLARGLIWRRSIRRAATRYAAEQRA